MNNTLKAVIFDMDGVLVDSEPLWRKAMIMGFTEIEIAFTEEDCRKTTGIRFTEVVELWLDHHNMSHIVPKVLEDRITDLLLELIANEGKAMDGISEIIAFCKEKNLKTGLATSSSNRLMNAVLKKLGLEDTFDVVLSAEFMPYGKPHPEVFINCAKALGVPANACMVIEDSLNGIIAAKAAQMKVIAVPDEEHKKMPQFAVADHQFNNMHEALVLFKMLLPGINNA